METSEAVLSGEGGLGEKRGESVLESALRLVGERSEVVGKERIRGRRSRRRKAGGVIRRGGIGMHRTGVGWRCGQDVVGRSDDYL